MYSTCIFCQKSLGTNEVIESFPIGRRLAFDSAKGGRFWSGPDRLREHHFRVRWGVSRQCARSAVAGCANL